MDTDELKLEIQSLLCAVAGVPDEYARGYQDCGMAILGWIEKHEIKPEKRGFFSRILYLRRKIKK